MSSIIRKEAAHTKKLKKALTQFLQGKKPDLPITRLRLDWPLVSKDTASTGQRYGEYSIGGSNYRCKFFINQEGDKTTVTYHMFEPVKTKSKNF